jgi:hypothetical protein
VGPDAPAEEGEGNQVRALVGDRLGEESLGLPGQKHDVVTTLSDPHGGLAHLDRRLTAHVKAHFWGRDVHLEVPLCLLQQGIGAASGLRHQGAQGRGVEL